MTIRVRFAPSPTGMLHIGNARTALFNWLFVRHHGGEFVFRIEDTDRERSTKESEISIMEDIAWLGLDWNEGPDKPGAHGPYRQSERTSIYEDHCSQLLNEGKAYRCYCTKEELEAVKEAQRQRKEPPSYPGTCRNLSPEERADREKQGLSSVVRLRIEPEDILVNDLIRGEVVFGSHTLGGDFVLFRSDGGVMYNFAVVIDDVTMKITHVLRGEDHLTNTAKQILIYRALGYEPPQFGHMAMILGPDRAKLSKRHGTVSVRQFKDEGYLPEALFNYMSLLGWNPGDEREKMPREEILREFSLERLTKSAAIFDFKKLRWMNGLYIRDLDRDQLFAAARPYLPDAGNIVAERGEEWLKDVLWLFRDNVEVLTDFAPRVGMIAAFEAGEEAQKLFAEEASQQVMRAFRDELAGLDGAKLPLTTEIIDEILPRVQEATGAKGRKLFMPLRAAMIGSPHGPDIRVVGPMLGRDEVVRRLDAALGV